MGIELYNWYVDAIGIVQGATPTVQKSIPEGVEQVFAMSRDISAQLKEDLAWGTYILLRNTNSISVVRF